jgi:phosphatidylglycerophosphate synthase
MQPFRGVRLFGRYLSPWLAVYEGLWLLGAIMLAITAAVCFWRLHQPVAGWVLLGVAAVFVAVVAGVQRLVYKRSSFQPYD